MTHVDAVAIPPPRHVGRFGRGHLAPSSSRTPRSLSDAPGSAGTNERRPGVLLVVAEAGTTPVHEATSLGACEQFAVVAQCSHETPLEMVPRLIRRLETLEREGRQVVQATLVMNSKTDDAAMGARRLALNALIRHAARTQRPTDVSLLVPEGLDEYRLAKIRAMANVFSETCTVEGVPSRIRVDTTANAAGATQAAASIINQAAALR